MANQVEAMLEELRKWAELQPDQCKVESEDNDIYVWLKESGEYLDLKTEAGSILNYAFAALLNAIESYPAFWRMGNDGDTTFASIVNPNGQGMVTRSSEENRVRILLRCWVDWLTLNAKNL